MSKRNKVYAGIVESIGDPTFSGRIKVRIPGIHDKISTELLPWCNYTSSNVFSGNGGGSISIPKVGAHVKVRYRSDEPSSLEWSGASYPDPKMIQEIMSDYAGAQVMMFDSEADLKILYQVSNGLLLYLKGSFIQITPDQNITIHSGLGQSNTQIQLTPEEVFIQAQKNINITAGETVNIEGNAINIGNSRSDDSGKNISTITMRGDGKTTPFVRGNELANYLKTLSTIIDGKYPLGHTAKSLTSTQKQSFLDTHTHIK